MFFRVIIWAGWRRGAGLWMGRPALNSAAGCGRDGVVWHGLDGRVLVGWEAVGRVDRRRDVSF